MNINNNKKKMNAGHFYTWELKRNWQKLQMLEILEKQFKSYDSVCYIWVSYHTRQKLDHPFHQEARGKKTEETLLYIKEERRPFYI